MRLLNVKTRRLEEFLGEDIPKYAILSHTWGLNEVTFKDIEQKGYKSGSKKIDGCCREATKNKLNYVWIDTCCIDKSSSAELSEAINSMWSWYSSAEICYAYLSDVPQGDVAEHENSAFRKSRWFTRGWTLQELIAPCMVYFYDEAWGILGSRRRRPLVGSLRSIISAITKIPSEMLEDNYSLQRASVAQKMSWAAGRTTTRTEDVAYSLLGLFSVSMDMLYGEGNRAFRRLQEEIIKSSDDESIFAWGFSQTSSLSNSLFASSPKDFSICGSLIPSRPAGVKSSHYSVTNKGIHIEMSICDVHIGGEVSFGRLNCSSTQNIGLKSIVLPLIRSIKDDNTLFRGAGCRPILVSSKLFPESARAPVYIQGALSDNIPICHVGFKVKGRFCGIDFPYMITEFYPPAWSAMLYGGSMFNRLEMGHLLQQNVFFLCESAQKPNFAVRIDFTFQVHGMFITWITYQEVKCQAAFTRKGTSLAELMIENRGHERLETALDWRESLDFGDTELVFSLDKRVELLCVLNMDINLKLGRGDKTGSES